MIHREFSIEANGQTGTLTTFIPENYPEIEENRVRPLVIICPGGGYHMVSEREADPVAYQFLAKGVAACVLRYTVAPARFPTALMQLAEAVALVRGNAASWHVDPDRIVVAGFSAGGHLACSLGMFWNQRFLAERMDREAGAYRPNAMLLAYPVITSGIHAHKGSFEQLLGGRDDSLLELLSLEKQVTADTPPAFIWHTYTDDTVPVENSLLLAAALREKQIPLELHIYPTGGHGLSLANEETASVPNQYGIWPSCQNWIDMAIRWIKEG